MTPERLVKAILANLDGWIDAAEEIHGSAEDGDLSQVRRQALHHKRNMMQVKNSLETLLGRKQTDFTGRA